jgi:YfiH family protein
VPAGDDDEQAISARRAAVLKGSWSWLRQVHGADVVTVEHPGGARGVCADALVTRRPGAVLAVFTADCAPIALASQEGVVGVVHAGWRGVLAGVIGRAVDAMRAVGANSITAALGPCIRAGCYEFAPSDLDHVVAAVGETARSTTSWGTPALDLAAAVQSSLSSVGVELAADAGACTACSTVWFSHRARADTGRQATLVWLAT